VDDPPRLSVNALDEAESLCQRNWETDPIGWGHLRASILTALGASLATTRNHERVLTVTDRLVLLQRRLTAPSRAALDPALANALRLFAMARIHADSELEAALPAVTEASAIYHRLAQSSPEAFGATSKQVDELLAVARQRLGHSV